MLFQDVRYAVRSLWHSKAFATVAVLCLAFGIGLNTTIFSIVDGVLLKPYPYPDPDRIVMVRSANESRDIVEDAISYPDWQDYKAKPGAFSTIAALQYRSMTISDSGAEPERMPGAAVSWDMFPLLGVVPIRGQGFTREMDRPGGGGVVLISHSTWRDRYQFAEDVVGRRVLLNTRPAVIIGVMPEGFAFPEIQRLWVPLEPVANASGRGQRDLMVLARLAPGVTMASASGEVRTMAGRLASEYKDTNDGWTAYLQTLREAFVPPDVTLIIWLMMASVTLVLFIACSNVANLQLARAAGRQRELSVRSALGAGRARIVRQLITESIVLNLISLPFAIPLAQLGSRLIFDAMPPDDVPYYITWTVDWRTMAFSVVVAIVTAALFGLLPAMQASRGNLVDSLKEGTRGNSIRRSPLRSALVVVQVSLALVALVSALLFVRSFSNLDSYNVGFDSSRQMTMRIYMGGEVYEAPNAKHRRIEDIVRRVEALPQVEAAFASNLVPISGGGGGSGVIIDGQSFEKGKEPFASFVGVTPHFHRTLGVAITAGSDFTDAQGWSSDPVAIINETMADRHWKGRSPIGARIKFVDAAEPAPWYTVIGVAPDIKHDEVDPEDEPYAAVYVPYHFQQMASTGLTIRVSGEPASIMPAVRDVIKAADSTLPLSQVRTMEEVRQRSFWQFGLFGWIFGVTGLVGLLLASVGVYGVLSYVVTQRTAEIGVRMALGAERRQVLRLIVGHGVVLAGIGVLIGLVLAPAATYLGRSFFYNVSPFDPITFAGVAIFLLVVAVLASYIPALRATRVNPVQALRGE
jgi:putative ABC transport system permease protein